MKTQAPLIVADEPLLRLGIRHFLSETAGGQRCLEADTAATALKQQAEHHPALIILCACGKPADTVRLIRDLRRRVRGQAVLIVRRVAEAEHVQVCLGAGALGYVMAVDELPELQLACAAVLKKDLHISRLATRHLQLNSSSKSARPTKTTLPEGLLSAREREVLQLLASGCGCKEMSAQLGIIVKTIETHQHRMKEKLNLRHCSELKRLATGASVLPA